MSTYPASKAAISFYSDTLADEFSHTNVKIQCLIPLLVATKIASYENHEANDIFVVKSETFAKYAVNIIGRFRLSTGCFAHDMQVSIQC
jgi:short-subunit dehydrogenase